MTGAQIWKDVQNIAITAATAAVDTENFNKSLANDGRMDSILVMDLDHRFTEFLFKNGIGENVYQERSGPENFRKTSKLEYRKLTYFDIMPMDHPYFNTGSKYLRISAIEEVISCLNEYGIRAV